MNKTLKFVPSLTTLGLVGAVALILTAASIDPALAQTGGGGGAAFQPINTAFGQILDFATGPFATTAATIAVAFFGYLALTGTIRWGVCLSIVAGIASIFGSAQIVQTLSGVGG
ncbi:TrbC/VirB2 family protein [Microvirga sp. VF16]|uniref:TrbC/VirB2 family protein n=1 Tax=Microvirga sp. VF16 TaxID=2807101 RepID=UPI00193C8AC4|nr:TrbC/VirB2 family protein [Microvirga sp. VF16]QRM32746.1 TrbC/VirB2 family protein [Microvirga sp. VF16]